MVGAFLGVTQTQNVSVILCFDVKLQKLNREFQLCAIYILLWSSQPVVRKDVFLFLLFDDWQISFRVARQALRFD